MILEYVSLPDRVLDVITVADEVTYRTGKARGLFTRWVERSGSPGQAAKDLDGWSNGYALIRAKSKEVRGMRSGICLRSYGFELRDSSGDGLTMSGYAAVFNSPTTIRDLQGEFEETILPGAFKRSIAERTPVLQWDHGRDPSVGTAPIGDIQDLREDEHGLFVRARLYDHPSTGRVRQAIKGKSVKGMSFRFSVPDGGDTWSTRDGLDVREIRDVDMAELGPVAFPAYRDTSVTVRSVLSQLDPDEYRALLEELAADLRNLPDLAGRPARGAGGGDSEVQPRSGAFSGLPYDLIPKRTLR